MQLKLEITYSKYKKITILFLEYADALVIN